METRVFGIDFSDLNIDNIAEISNEDWMSLAEEQGYVFSLQGFVCAFNDDVVGNILIRII